MRYEQLESSQCVLKVFFPLSFLTKEKVYFLMYFKVTLPSKFHHNRNGHTQDNFGRQAKYKKSTHLNNMWS